MNCDIFKIIQNGTPKELKDCIDTGANVNVADKYGRTPLHIAVSWNLPEIVRILLEAGANTNARNKYDEMTPLHNALYHHNYPKIIHMLLEAGANVNVANKYGSTPLHLAADWNLEIVRMLLEAGADLNTRNNEGQIPQDLAKDPTIIQLLEPRQLKKAGFLAIGKRSNRSKRNKRSKRKK